MRSFYQDRLGTNIGKALKCREDSIIGSLETLQNSETPQDLPRLAQDARMPRTAAVKSERFFSSNFVIKSWDWTNGCDR